MASLIDFAFRIFTVYATYSIFAGLMGGGSTTPSVEKNSSGEDEVVVAIMGVTGAGKSTFIQTVTGNHNVHVGHTLESDTPGFNDTYATDDLITAKLLTWLQSSYQKGVRLNGIIYLHRIIDPKIQGSARSNIRMFKKLCGAHCFPNIVLATTFWESIDKETGAAREEKLKTEDSYWGLMVAKGSRVRRLRKNREDGLAVLIEIAEKMGKIVLQSQVEMSQGLSIKDTAAAQDFSEELVKHQRELDEMLERERKAREAEILKKEAERIKRVRQERLRVLREAERLQRQKAEEEARLERERLEEIRIKERESQEIKRQAEILRKAQEEEAAKLAKMRREAEERQRENIRKLNEERQTYYRNYTCLRTSGLALVCDKCLTAIENTWYNHCCHCRGDDYDQCISCGDRCPVNEHPTMKFLFTSRPTPPPRNDDCIVQ